MVVQHVEFNIELSEDPKALLTGTHHLGHIGTVLKIIDQVHQYLAEKSGFKTQDARLIGGGGLSTHPSKCAS